MKFGAFGERLKRNDPLQEAHSAFYTSLSAYFRICADSGGNAGSDNGLVAFQSTHKPLFSAIASKVVGPADWSTALVDVDYAEHGLLVDTTFEALSDYVVSPCANAMDLVLGIMPPERALRGWKRLAHLAAKQLHVGDLPSGDYYNHYHQQDSERLKRAMSDALGLATLDPDTVTVGAGVTTLVEKFGAEQTARGLIDFQCLLLQKNGN